MELNPTVVDKLKRLCLIAAIVLDQPEMSYHFAKYRLSTFNDTTSSKHHHNKEKQL